jgi:hypothetical protein
MTPCSILPIQCCYSGHFSHSINFSSACKRTYFKAVYHPSITADISKFIITTKNITTSSENVHSNFTENGSYKNENSCRTYMPLFYNSTEQLSHLVRCRGSTNNTPHYILEKHTIIKGL